MLFDHNTLFFYSMASFYLEEVLVKEALAGIFQSFTGQSYEVADTECGCTEQLSLNMAAKKGAELCKFKFNDKHFIKWKKNMQLFEYYVPTIVLFRRVKSSGLISTQTIYALSGPKC